MSRRAHDDEKYDIKPFDCVSSGQVYRDFKNAALRFLAGILDESGSSLANHAIDDDMGGAAAGAPALPNANQAVQRTKMLRLRTVRSKKLYAWLVRHLEDESTCKMLGQVGGPYFQNGQAVLAYLDMYDTAILQTDVRELNNMWNEVSIAKDIGISLHSINEFAKKLNYLNSERPLAIQFNHTELAEKMLESIIDCSAYMSKDATAEYNAAVGNREFEYAAGNPRAGQRDFVSMCKDYNAMWQTAVIARHILPAPPSRKQQQQPSARMAEQREQRAFLVRERMGAYERAALAPTKRISLNAQTNPSKQSRPSNRRPNRQTGKPNRQTGKPNQSRKPIPRMGKPNGQTGKPNEQTGKPNGQTKRANGQTKQTKQTTK